MKIPTLIVHFTVRKGLSDHFRSIREAPGLIFFERTVQGVYWLTPLEKGERTL